MKNGFGFGFGFMRRDNGASGGGGGWNIADMTQALQLNPATEDKITKNGGDPDLVSAWVEELTARDWINNSDPTKPHYDATGANGYPMVSFIDSDALTDDVNISSSGVYAADDMLVIMVARARAVTGSRFWLRFCAGGFELQRSGSSIRATVYDGAARTATHTATLGTSKFVVVGVKHTGGQVSIDVNGGGFVSAAAGDQLLMTNTDQSIGHSSGSADNMDLAFLAIGKWSTDGGTYDADVAGLMARFVSA